MCKYKKGQLDYDGMLFDLSYVFIWGYEYSVASSFACFQPYGYCRERIVQHHTQNEVGWYFIYIADGLCIQGKESQYTWKAQLQLF